MHPANLPMVISHKNKDALWISIVVVWTPHMRNFPRILSKDIHIKILKLKDFPTKIKWDQCQESGSIWSTVCSKHSAEEHSEFSFCIALDVGVLCNKTKYHFFGFRKVRLNPREVRSRLEKYDLQLDSKKLDLDLDLQTSEK